jgi:hypothetical protein
LREIFGARHFDQKLKAIFQLVDHGPSRWMAGACFRIFSETLEMVMTIPPRTIQSPADLHDQLQWKPHIIYDPVPWWWLQHLDKAELSKYAQISLQHQKDVLAAQTKALDATIKAMSGG